ncbi:class I SAM-dependent methyltransferase [Rhodococcus sp. H29-C3]|uniref:class I SAM-dependent methyltransferase n=1 Tax=Rhodococcus sp. H29-C3 TaxID=3046307 RepID=UPI0024BB9AE1|nr:class I SAM-dependent methyltransferase [Rhodococcus sp. H29-C3]MDJ0362316.1 class I SAM-dependent methyltransferase [Rhodococcus sp. H29-C3]
MTSTGDIPFDKLYGDGEKMGPLMPWNIGGPQPAVRALCDGGGFRGHVVDLGCGLGDNALYLASTGLQVTGIDVSHVAIDCARDKAKRLGLEVDFQVADAFGLAEAGTTFDSILDSAFFHTLPKESVPEYSSLVRSISVVGAELQLFTFSEEMTPDFPGPRRVSATELRTAFSADWIINTISSAQYSSSLPAEAVSQMVDPRTFELDAPTKNLSGVSIDATGCVVSSIWHMHATRGPAPTS